MTREVFQELCDSLGSVCGSVCAHADVASLFSGNTADSANAADAEEVNAAASHLSTVVDVLLRTSDGFYNTVQPLNGDSNKEIDLLKYYPSTLRRMLQSICFNQGIAYQLPAIHTRVVEFCSRFHLETRKASGLRYSGFFVMRINGCCLLVLLVAQSETDSWFV